MQPENIFLFLGLLFGLFFCFVTPSMQVADEWSHYVRILQVSQGDLLPERQGNVIGAKLNTNEIDFVRQSQANTRSFFWAVSNSPAKNNNNSRVFIGATSTYNPVAYMPQIVGVLFAKTFSLNQALIFYFARLFSLFLYLAVCYAAIRLIPIGKWFGTTVALLPMSLSLAASNSSDGLVIATSFFVIAFALHLFLKERLVRKDFYIIFLTTTLIAFLKMPYFLVAALYLFVPLKQFQNKKYYFIYLISLLLIIVGISLSLGYLVSTFNSGEIIQTMFAGIKAEPNKQFLFVLRNPLTYAYIFVKTIWLQGGVYLNSAIGSLGFESIWFNCFIYYSYCVLLTTTLFVDSGFTKWLAAKVRIGALVLFFVMFSIIPSILYLVYTPVGAQQIGGVQGRYFLPLFFLIPILIDGVFIKEVTVRRTNMLWLLFIGNFVLLSLCAYHFLWYYFPLLKII